MCCDKFHEPEPKSCESGKTIHIFKYYFVISNWGFETMNFIFLECLCNLFIQWKRQWNVAQEAGQSMSTNDDLLSKSLKINMQRVHSDSLLWHRIALIDRLQVKITETPSISFTKNSNFNPSCVHCHLLSSQAKQEWQKNPKKWHLFCTKLQGIFYLVWKCIWDCLSEKVTVI